MDLASSCKDKLAHFRIKELKDVLTQLGLSKQGKKQDLVDRILAILSDERVPGTWTKKNAVAKEEVAKLVDDTYRKMQGSGAAIDLASKGQCVSDSSNIKLKEETEDSYQMDKTRCPCSNSLKTDSMIKCEDSRCNVWQHIGCVIIPEKPMEGVLPIPPEIFYCELCRLTRADPFWVTVAHPLLPVRLTITNIPTEGTNPMQSVERTFQLTRADKDLLAKQEYDVQAWCMLLNDKVPFRMQWPQYADLQINGVPVRAINRPGSQLLGANGRDDGPVITPCTRDGINKISLTGCDARVFCLGVRIVKRRTVQHILALIPKEADGELFEDALARVRRCVGGGTPTENADSDSDLEVVSDSIPVNLRCPMSGSRMKVAGRFKPCAHMGCFDLDVFVEMNQRSRKWQCPICLKNYSLENIIIDPYFNRITSKMRNCEEDVTEIEVKPDGSWRAKVENDRRFCLGDLGQWHFPDGTLCEAKSKSEVVPNHYVKQELGSEGHNTGLKIGIKKNRNGRWEVSKPGDGHTNSSSNNNKLEKNFENGHNIVIPMSSSTTGSGGNGGDDRSVNQDGGGGNNYDFSTNNGELDSFALNLDSASIFQDQNPSAAALGDAEVIILSDSEEENEEALVSSAPPVHMSNAGGGPTYSVPPHGIPDSFPQDPGLGLFNTNDDDEFGISLWPGNHGGPGFQLFGSEADGSDTLVDMHHSSINCPTSMNGGYSLTDATIAPPEPSFHHSSDADLNEGLVDNPLAFGGDDPSLQLFLPTRQPSDNAAAVPSDLMRHHQSDVSSNGFRTEDWISLRLGGGGGGGLGGPAAGANGSSFKQQQLPAKEGALHSLANTGMNENRCSKTSRERSDSPFSFPRQRRS